MGGVGRSPPCAAAMAESSPDSVSQGWLEPAARTMWSGSASAQAETRTSEARVTPPGVDRGGPLVHHPAAAP